MSELPNMVSENLLIRTADAAGKPIFSRFDSWIHHEADQVAQYVDLTTESGHKLSLTENHLIYKTDCQGLGPRVPVLAGDVQVGSCVLVQDANGALVPTTVESTEKSTKTGIYSPITAEGSIIVDGVLASCYSSVQSEGLQKFMFSYISAISNLLPSNLAVGGSNAATTPHLVYAFLDVAKHWVA